MASNEKQLLPENWASALQQSLSFPLGVCRYLWLIQQQAQPCWLVTLTLHRDCNDAGLDCFCVGNGWTPQVTRLLCIWWSSSSQAMIQEEWSPLDLLPVKGMQWEDAQTVYTLTRKRQISLKVGRQGWILGAPTSLNPQQGKLYQLSSVLQWALWWTVLQSPPPNIT